MEDILLLVHDIKALPDERWPFFGTKLKIKAYEGKAQLLRESYAITRELENMDYVDRIGMGSMHYVDGFAERDNERNEGAGLGREEAVLEWLIKRARGPQWR